MHVFPEEILNQRILAGSVTGEIMEGVEDLNKLTVRQYLEKFIARNPRYKEYKIIIVGI